MQWLIMFMGRYTDDKRFCGPNDYNDDGEHAPFTPTDGEYTFHTNMYTPRDVFHSNEDHLNDDYQTSYQYNTNVPSTQEHVVVT